jgi:hypothetical protein
MPIYLGDGLYAEKSRWPGEVCLYASNGITRTSEVYLDMDMLDQLHTWAHTEGVS